MYCFTKGLAYLLRVLRLGFYLYFIVDLSD